MSFFKLFIFCYFDTIHCFVEFVYPIFNAIYLMVYKSSISQNWYDIENIISYYKLLFVFIERHVTGYAVCYMCAVCLYSTVCNIVFVIILCVGILYYTIISFLFWSKSSLFFHRFMPMTKIAKLRYCAWNQIFSTMLFTDVPIGLILWKP